MSENADKNLRRRKNRLEKKSADVIDHEELISEQLKQREIDGYIRYFDEEIKSCCDDYYGSNVYDYIKFFDLISNLQKFCTEHDEMYLFRERVESFYQNLEVMVEDSEEGNYKDTYSTLCNYRRLYELTGIAPPPINMARINNEEGVNGLFNHSELYYFTALANNPDRYEELEVETLDDEFHRLAEKGSLAIAAEAIRDCPERTRQRIFDICVEKIQSDNRNSWQRESYLERAVLLKRKFHLSCSPEANKAIVDIVRRSDTEMVSKFYTSQYADYFASDLVEYYERRRNYMELVSEDVELPAVPEKFKEEAKAKAEQYLQNSDSVDIHEALDFFRTIREMYGTIDFTLEQVMPFTVRAIVAECQKESPEDPEEYCMDLSNYFGCQIEPNEDLMIACCDKALTLNSSPTELLIKLEDYFKLRRDFTRAALVDNTKAFFANAWRISADSLRRHFFELYNQEIPASVLTPVLCEALLAPPAKEHNVAAVQEYSGGKLKFDRKAVQARYMQILECQNANFDAGAELEALRSMTKVNFDFQRYKRLIHRTYCRYYLDCSISSSYSLDELKRKVDKLMAVTGVSFKIEKSDVLKSYDELLERHTSDSYMNDTVQHLNKLHEITHVPIRFSEAILANKIRQLLSERKVSDLATLAKVPGVAVEWQALAADVQQCYNVMIASDSIEYSFSSRFSDLQTLTGIAPEFQPATVQERCRQLLSERKVSELLTLAKVPGVAVEWQALAADVQQCYNVMIASDSIEYSFSSRFSDLQTLTGIAPEFQPATVQERCRQLLSERKVSELLTLAKVPGVTVEWPTLAADVQQCYNGMIAYCKYGNDFAGKIKELQTLTAIQPEFSPDAILALSRKFLSDHDMKSLQELSKVPGMTIEWSDLQVEVQTCYNAMLASDSINESFAKRFKDLQALTGIAPEFQPDTVLTRCRQLLSERKVSDLATLAKVAGDTIEWPTLAADVQATYLGMLSQYKYGNNFVSIAQSLQTLTSIAPEFSVNATPARCRQLLIERDVASLESLVQFPGVTVEWSDLQAEVQVCYNTMLASDSINESFAKRFKDLQALTGIAPEFQPDTVLTRCRQLLSERKVSDLATLAKVPGMTIEWSELQAEVQVCYNAMLANDSINSSFAQRFKDLQALTGIAPEYSREATLLLFSRAMVQNGLQLIMDVPNLNFTFDGHQTELAGAYRMLLVTNPTQAAELLKRTDATSLQLLEVIKETSGVRACQRLQSMQAIGKKYDKDPWRNEFQPLLKSAVKSKVILSENEADLELVVGFVREMGMINLPTLFAVYCDCQRAKSFENLSASTIETFTQFKIGLKYTQGPKTGEWRFPKPTSAFQELKKAAKRYEDDLLENKLPPGITTVLGQELFSKMRGESAWERSDSLSAIVTALEQTAVAHPEVNVPLPSFEPATFSVNMIARAEADSSDEDAAAVKAQELAEYFESSAVKENYSSQAQALHESLVITELPVWWNLQIDNIAQAFINEKQELEVFIAASPEKRQEIINAEQNEEKQKKLQKRAKSLNNPLALAGLEKTIVNLQSSASAISELKLAVDADVEEKTMSGLMERLLALNINHPAIPVLMRALSALHIQSVAPEGFKTQIKQLFSDESEPSIERVNFLSEFSRQYLLEHYLHEAQQTEHTEHAPFSDDLRATLLKSWQLLLVNNKLPAEKVKYKVDSITLEKKEALKTEVDVTMHPAAGLLRVFSGDIGDACYSSQHYGLARNEYPGIGAWIYLSRAGNREVIRGSALTTIAKEKQTGAEVLVMRANNPRESFIQGVSADDFVINSLQVVIETGRRRWKQGEKEIVAVTLSESSRSSTNRPLIADANHRYFKGCRRVQLEDTPETNFNNYDIWNATGLNACGVIWEKDEDGNETYYGDWPVAEKEADVA